MKIHPLITTSEALADLCARLSQADFVCVDTEFMRENTYWPELCLIQIADANEAAAIDPLAKDLDMSPLLDLLVDNEDVLKVFHAGGQDVEIVYNLTGKTPHPIFDTQIAMMAVSQSEQIGYSNLVESWLGLTIDKGARFTDWGRRPLTERQIEYAIGDVTHLAKIFPKLLQRLIKTGRGEWLDIEMEKLADPANYRNDPDQAWQRIKAPGRNPAMLGRLKALAHWRELEAQDKNIPRGRIARDETVADIACHPPKTQADLAKVRGLSAAWKDNEIGKRLMAAIESAKPLSDAELPPRTPRGAPLGKEGALVADLLKLLLKIRSREIDVASRLLARSEDLELLAAGIRELPLLKSWRFDVFGKDALDLVEGKMAFAVVNGKLKMTRIEAPDPAAEEAPADEPSTETVAETAE
ncbi:MAG: ribonuclease D [Sphingomonadaceae bacterium]|nr:ribonuclease D [Sphingomonadaceae bacterium]